MIIDRSRLPIKHMLTFGLLPSALKVAWYRLRGARIGKKVKLGLGAVILSKDIEIGDGTRMGMAANITCERLRIGKRADINTFVVINAQEVSIGNDVTISEAALINPLISSTQSKFILHDRVHIFPFTVIDTTRKVEIGEESCVGIKSSIYTHSSYKSQLDGYSVKFGEVTIGKGVWLSSHVFINQAVTIGDEAVIGTGTVVSRDIPAGMLVASAPTRLVKSKEDYIEHHTDKEKLAMLADIIDEFCQYLSDFAGFTCQRTDSDAQPNWSLASRKNHHASKIELMSSCPESPDLSLSVILSVVPKDVRQKWDGEKRMWFSIGSGCCSAHLDDLGEELLEYFKRYGIYFARP